MPSVNILMNNIEKLGEIIEEQDAYYIENSVKKNQKMLVEAIIRQNQNRVCPTCQSLDASDVFTL